MAVFSFSTISKDEDREPGQAIEKVMDCFCPGCATNADRGGHCQQPADARAQLSHIRELIKAGDEVAAASKGPDYYDASERSALAQRYLKARKEV